MKGEPVLAQNEATRTKETVPQRQDASNAVMDDLRSLRRLALRLQRRAASADEPMLRALLGKREALLNSLSARLGEPHSDGAPLSGLPESHREAIARTIEEIAAMDHKTRRALQARLD